MPLGKSSKIITAAAKAANQYFSKINKVVAASPTSIANLVVGLWTPLCRQQLVPIAFALRSASETCTPFGRSEKQAGMNKLASTSSDVIKKIMRMN